MLKRTRSFRRSPPWHLDRIDQNYLPLDNRLSFSDLDGTQRGEGVYVYVLDTGVQSKHAELRGKIDYADWALIQMKTIFWTSTRMVTVLFVPH